MLDFNFARKNPANDLGSTWKNRKFDWNWLCEAFLKFVTSGEFVDFLKFPGKFRVFTFQFLSNLVVFVIFSKNSEFSLFSLSDFAKKIRENYSVKCVIFLY